MTRQQLDEIMAIISGQQFCISHLAKLVAQRTGVDLATLAQSIESAAQEVEIQEAQRDAFQLPAKFTADSLRGAAADEEWQELMDRLSKDQP